MPRSARSWVAALKDVIVLFWASWFTVVFLSNAADGLKALGVVGEGWAFASGNWLFLLATTKIYGLPTLLVAALFAAVIAWEGICAALMWRALLSPGGGGPHQRNSPGTAPAFVLAIGLFGAFALADEIFIAYPVEATHLRIFTALLASLLVLWLLPDAGPAR